MANIEIDNLHPAGSELFQDSESFLNDLSDREVCGIKGGLLTLLLGPESLGQGSINVTGADSIGTLGETLGGTLGGVLGLLSLGTV